MEIVLKYLIDNNLAIYFLDLKKLYFTMARLAGKVACVTASTDG